VAAIAVTLQNFILRQNAKNAVMARLQNHLYFGPPFKTMIELDENKKGEKKTMCTQENQ